LSVVSIEIISNRAYFQFFIIHAASPSLQSTLTPTSMVQGQIIA
jgi:hypothetical protein